MILQSLVNLVLNARDAIDVRSGTIRVRAQRLETFVRIEVADDGPDIPRELLPRLGTPLVSTKGEKGTGLGLFMVRSGAEASGGVLTVESEPGKGTVVAFTVPVAAKRAAEPTVPRGAFGRGARAR